MSKNKEKVKVFAGRYAYVKPLGRGAGGSVYLAEDLRADRRQVALKVLTPEAYSTVQGKMLRREFEILSKLDHPHLVRVYDYGRLPDGGVFLAEEYIDGFSLQDARALLEPEALIGVTLQILNGLAYLHGMGMIHRDIKPANVMLLWLEDANVEPMIKLVDFGLSSMDPKRDTLRGGTRSYMAPEIIRGEKGAPESDMFSLGVTLYYALCGVLPFGPRSKDDPPPTEEDFRPPDPHRLNPEVPLSLSRFTMALLRQVDDVEFQDAGEAMQSLARDVEDNADVGVGRFANSLDTSAPQILRGYFERGILLQQQEDYEYLVRELTETKESGRGLLYMLAGASGMGKSRLLRDVETSCKLSGRLVITVDCSESMPPWGLMSRIYKRLMAQLPKQLIEDLERYQEHLTILEELVNSRSQNLLIERQERWIHSAFTKLSAEIAGERPIICVEDFHHADKVSREFLEEWFAQRTSSKGIDFLVACEPDADLTDLAESPATRPVLCEGVQREDVDYLFFDRMKIDELPDDLIDAIVEHAEGQPAYLEEVCRSLVDSGVLRRESASNWSLDKGALVTFSLPSGLRESFRRRLNVVGASGRELLELMAIIDRPIEWSFLRDLAEAGGEDGMMVDRMLETLRWRHLIRVDMEMSGRYVSVIHPAVKQVVELLLNPEWRRALNRRVGELMEIEWRKHGGDAREVARHLRAGGLDERASSMYWACGQQALAEGDWQRAKEALWLARDLSGPDMVLVELERAKVSLAMLEVSECMGALERAERGAQKTGLDWLMFQTAVVAAQCACSLGRPNHAATVLDELEDLLPVMAQQPKFLEGRARVAFARGEMDASKKTWEMCRDRYDHFGNPEGVLAACSALAVIAGVRGDADEAGKMLQQTYDLARAHGMRAQLGEALMIHAQLMRLGDAPDRALQLLNDALDAMRDGTYAALWIDILIEFSYTYEALEEFGSAEQRAIEALLLARRLEHETGEALGTILISDMAMQRTESGHAGHLVRMREACEALTSHDLYVHWQALGTQRLGRALARHGHVEESNALLDKSAELGRTIGADTLYGRTGDASPERPQDIS